MGISSPSVAPLLLPCCSACCSPVAPLVAPLLLACCSPRLILQQDPTDGVQWRQSSLVQIGRMAVPRGAEEETKSGAGRMSPKTGKTGKTGKNREKQENTYPAHQPDRKNRKKYPGPAGGRLVPGGFFSCFSFPAGGLDRCFPVFAWFFPVFPVFPVFWLIRPAPEFVFLFGSSGN